MRLRLRTGRTSLAGIWFASGAELPSLEQGDLVDVAYIPQINDYRGERTVQLNVQDIRPSCKAECSMDTAGYHALQNGNLDAATAAALLPDRNTLGMVWRYLAAVPGGQLQETPACLCRKLVRCTNTPLHLGQLLVCLDIFADVGLVELTRQHKHMTIRLIPTEGKADLAQSKTMQLLAAAKENDPR